MFYTLLQKYLLVVGSRRSTEIALCMLGSSTSTELQQSGLGACQTSAKRLEVLKQGPSKVHLLFFVIFEFRILLYSTISWKAVYCKNETEVLI